MLHSRLRVHLGTSIRCISLTIALFVLLLPASSVSADDSESEVIVVQDVTVQSGCVTTWEVYDNEDRRNLIRKDTEPCQLGAVLHSTRMAEATARALGLGYVVVTGDTVRDERALSQLKAEYRVAQNQMIDTSSNPKALSSCGIAYQYTRYMSYSAEGGIVRTGVQYKDDPNWTYGCNTIAITHAFAYLTDPLDPGNDLYWDQGWYASGISAGGWDMGCQQLQNNGTLNNTYMSTWIAYGGDWYVDESINDTSLGCDWWGEEYTGSALLSTY